MSTHVADRVPRTSEYRLPEGPASPALLNGVLFLLPRSWSMRRLKARYGDACTLKLPVIGRTVVVSHPDLARAVFTAKPEVLHAGKNPLGSLLGPGSLFSMDEDRHLQERRTLLPPFHGDRMRSYERLIEEEALQAMQSWPDDEEFSTIRTFNRITLRVILRAVFGAEGAELSELEALLPRLTALGQRSVSAPILRRDLGPGSPGRRYGQLRRSYDRVVGALIDKHLADPDLGEQIDILAMMLNPLREAGETINRDEMADELLTLLVAGHETTAASLAWAVERIRRHPDVLRGLEEEAAGDSSALRVATVLEVHRTRPVITATGRLVMEPFDLGRWRLPPGTRVVTEASVMHHDERFHPNASKFDPGRYIADKPDTYAWIPFGGGVRRCIGAAFAQLEMDVVLRTVLRHFALRATDAPGERASFRGVAFAPADGGIAVVRRRSTPLATTGEPGAAAPQCPIAHHRSPAARALSASVPTESRARPS